MKTIRQRTSHDCTVCAMAMYLGRSYETTLKRFESQIKRFGLEFSGIESEAIPTAIVQVVALSFEKPFATLSETVVGSEMMLTIASPNSPSWLHMVYVDKNGLVYDPLKAEPEPFSPENHAFAEAHVPYRGMSPLIVRDLDGATIAAWPEILAKANAEHKKTASQ